MRWGTFNGTYFRSIGTIFFKEFPARLIMWEPIIIGNAVPSSTRHREFDLNRPFRSGTYYVCPCSTRIGYDTSFNTISVWNPIYKFENIHNIEAIWKWNATGLSNRNTLKYLSFWRSKSYLIFRILRSARATFHPLGKSCAQLPSTNIHFLPSDSKFL